METYKAELTLPRRKIDAFHIPLVSAAIREQGCSAFAKVLFIKLLRRSSHPAPTFNLSRTCMIVWSLMRAARPTLDHIRFLDIVVSIVFRAVPTIRTCSKRDPHQEAHFELRND